MGIYQPPKLGQLRRRDVPEGLISDMRGVSARCLFLPLADIGCGTFMSTRPLGGFSHIRFPRNAGWLLYQPPGSGPLRLRTGPGLDGSLPTRPP